MDGLIEHFNSSGIDIQQGPESHENGRFLWIMDPQGNKIFSAAEVRSEKGLQGYLYIILGGEDFDNVAEMISDSFILDSSMLVLLLAPMMLVRRHQARALDPDG